MIFYTILFAYNKRPQMDSPNIRKTTEITPPDAPKKSRAPVKLILDFDDCFEIEPRVLDFSEERPRKRARLHA